MAVKEGFWRKLLIRVLSSAVMLPLFIFTALRGGWFFFAFTFIASVLLLREFAQLASARGVRGVFPEMLPVVAAVLLGARWGGEAGASGAMGAGILILLIWMAWRGRIEGAWERASFRILGLIYVVWLPAHWMLLRDLEYAQGLPEGGGALILLYGAGVTWLGDTGAYLVGSLIGRHPLGTAVSPRKSVEGALGGLASSLAAAWLLRGAWMPFLSGGEALALGLLVGLGGQGGDLFESLLKRGVGSKDSGSTIPGHGGFLDRLDSLLFSLPLLYFALVWVIF